MELHLQLVVFFQLPMISGPMIGIIGGGWSSVLTVLPLLSPHFKVSPHLAEHAAVVTAACLMQNQVKIANICGQLPPYVTFPSIITISHLKIARTQNPLQLSSGIREKAGLKGITPPVVPENCPKCEQGNIKHWQLRYSAISSHLEFRSSS